MSKRRRLSLEPPVLSRALGTLPMPFLHGVSGTGGYIDEIISLVLIGAVVLILLGLTLLGGKRRRKASRRR